MGFRNPVTSLDASQITGQLAGSQLAADAIDGKTITGALIRTAATGARVEIAGGGLGVSLYSGKGENAPARLDIAPGGTGVDPQLELWATQSSIGGSAARLWLSGQDTTAAAGIEADSLNLSTKTGTGTIHATVGVTELLRLDSTGITARQLGRGSGAKFSTTLHTRKALAGTACASGTWNRVPYDTAVVAPVEDEGAAYTAGGIFTAPTEGIWAMSAGTAYPSAAGSHRVLKLANSGDTQRYAFAYLPASAPIRDLTVTWVGYLPAGGTICAWFYQDSGASMTTNADAVADPVRATFLRVA